MNITGQKDRTDWLLLVFSLPSNKASERVQIWRKLQKFGAIPFRNAGYLLPKNSENEERFAWVEAAVRSHRGEASSLDIRTVSDLSAPALQQLFRQARTPDYEGLMEEMQKLEAGASVPPAQIVRLRRRLDETVTIDYFANPLRNKAELALERLEHPKEKAMTVASKRATKKDYQKRTWMTRPRPGIDRAASAWLISRFIDTKPRFIFGNDPGRHPKAVPFDMYGDRGFAHEGDHCTFETLCQVFGLTDKKVMLIAQAIHDADLEDGKFGRAEGHTINQILRGWAKRNTSDDELLRKGIDLIDGLYQSIH
jgi:hypothetical protein